MELGLAGKVILVTGAGQGLGRAIGLAFAAEHAHVAFHYHSSADGAQGAAHQAQALGVKTLAVGADLRLEADVVAAVDRIERELGPIDVLINNAAATQRKLFLETRPEDWAAQIDVTVKGTLLITHAVVGRMAARRSGAIVNLMGDSGRVGESRLLVTATARAAAVGLTRSLAREFARSAIRANCVSIALVQTDHFDVHLPRMLHAAFVRSVHAHATLSAIAATRALASAGVVHVATGADETFARHRLTARSAAPGYVTTGQPILAWPIARYAGEPVAVVVASDRYAAEDGAMLVDVDYDPLAPAR